MQFSCEEKRRKNHQKKMALSKRLFFFKVVLFLYTNENECICTAVLRALQIILRVLCAKYWRGRDACSASSSS